MTQQIQNQIRRALVVLALLGAGCETPLAPNEVRVTYDHGESCIWTDWSFRYRRGISNNRASGAIMIVGPETHEVRDDTTLRVFSPDAEKLTIPGTDIREMRFIVEPDDNNSSNNRVSYLGIETESGSRVFWPEELPKFSRSRVLVPVASHYFPEVSDEYMTWGNVRMTLAGTVEEGCSIDREISLTRPGHYKKRTPALVEFAGS